MRTHPTIHVFVVPARARARARRRRSVENHVREGQCDRWEEVILRLAFGT